jgi:hypothetical protein
VATVRQRDGQGTGARREHRASQFDGSRCARDLHRLSGVQRPGRVTCYRDDEIGRTGSACTVRSVQGVPESFHSLGRHLYAQGKRLAGARAWGCLSVFWARALMLPRITHNRPVARPCRTDRGTPRGIVVARVRRLVPHEAAQNGDAEYPAERAPLREPRNGGAK